MWLQSGMLHLRKKEGTFKKSPSEDERIGHCVSVVYSSSQTRPMVPSTRSDSSPWKN